MIVLRGNGNGLDLSQIALRDLVEDRTQEFVAEMTIGGSKPAEEIWTAMIELKDLHSQLEGLRDEAADPGEPHVAIRAPLEPQPHLNSGAIAVSLRAEPN
jgi:hypothetical protein